MFKWLQELIETENQAQRNKAIARAEQGIRNAKLIMENLTPEQIEKHAESIANQIAVFGNAEMKIRREDFLAYLLKIRELQELNKKTTNTLQA